MNGSKVFERGIDRSDVNGEREQKTISVKTKQSKKLILNLLL